MIFRRTLGISVLQLVTLQEKRDDPATLQWVVSRREVSTAPQTPFIIARHPVRDRREVHFHPIAYGYRRAWRQIPHCDAELFDGFAIPCTDEVHRGLKREPPLMHDDNDCVVYITPSMLGVEGEDVISHTHKIMSKPLHIRDARITQNVARDFMWDEKEVEAAFDCTCFTAHIHIRFERRPDGPAIAVVGLIDDGFEVRLVVPHEPVQSLGTGREIEAL